MLRDIPLWWVRQMRGLVPRALLPDDNGADALIVATDGERDPLFVRLGQRRRRRETPLGRFRLDDGGQRAARAAVRQRPRKIVLRPEPSAFLERNVVLPLAAERDLANVLTYEMDRLTPFTASQVFWSAEVEHRDRAAGRLELRLLLVPKSLLQPVLAALDRIDLRPTAIEAVPDAGIRRRIDLQAPSGRRRVSLALASGVVAVLALGALVTPFVTQWLANRRVEARVAVLQPRIKEVEALRRRIAAGSAGSDIIAAENARIGDTFQVLATVTDLLPDGTVLGELSLREGKLEISGQSLAAAQLIPAMAADPLMHDPSFVAPVTRTADGTADTFVIRAALSP